ncbi:Asp/Glu racemase [Mariannaea sp. PMI_226]|nr:Asp/Glu racemase [Mariannaea sp. PMI_226]
MKTIGLLGGMSWESTVLYYQYINRRVREVKGGIHSAKCLLHSFDFGEVAALQHANDWDACGRVLEEASVGLKRAGADAIMICTNTMHLASDVVEPACGLPLIHIVDPTGESIVKAGHKTVALLGTRYVMEKDIYKARLTSKYGLRVITPNDEDRTLVHNIIYDELCNGIVKEESRATYYRIIKDLAKEGADCLIMGCTEFGLLGDGSEGGLPVFDTAKLHAIYAADWAMKDD